MQLINRVQHALRLEDRLQCPLDSLPLAYPTGPGLSGAVTSATPQSAHHQLLHPSKFDSTVAWPRSGHLRVWVRAAKPV